MEDSWLSECLFKLIEWKYGSVMQLQDLQKLEYDPGGSFCRFCRLLTTYSNAAVLLAMSFAVVTASGQYVNKGISPHSTNSSKLEPILGTRLVSTNREFTEGASFVTASPVDMLTYWSASADIKLMDDVLPATTKFVDYASARTSEYAVDSSENVIKMETTTTTTMTTTSTATANTSVSIMSTSISEGTMLSMNDSQVPRFSNRTPHVNDNPTIEAKGYFGVLSVVLGLMILLTIVGNVFVIAAILIEKNLQNVANYLIVSLAVADLMVACLVMPLGAVYEISEGWILGPELCDMWTASDVLCCTASILHLVAIALDRYWAVTDVEYVTRRSAWRIVVMIIIIWTVALIVSLAPQLGWKDPGFMKRINDEKKCLLSQDIGYQIFATCATFYVPLLAILVLYWKIFQAARRRIHKRALRNRAYGAANVAKNAALARKRFNFFNRAKKIPCDAHAHAHTAAHTNIALMDVPSSCSAAESSQENAPNKNASDYHDRLDHISVERALNSNTNSACEPTSTTKIFIETSMSTLITKHIQKVKSKRDKKQSIEAKREKKAAKTLAIITGAFVICWLPFFVMALVMPMCASCHINRYLSSFFLWLGYFNSTLNPIIYTVFSPEFRQAFNRILCGIHNSGLRNR